MGEIYTCWAYNGAGTVPRYEYLDSVVEGRIRSSVTFSKEPFLTGLKNSLSINEVVTNRTFSSTELFGQTSTVWFGPNDDSVWCNLVKQSFD